MSGLMPAYILRETYNDGKQLVGGKVYFYESLTNTPKTVYTDYTLSIPHTNPVILDAGAAADIWLGDGAYRIKITDMNDVQIRSPIDGVIASGSGAIVPGSNAKLAIVKTYMDLRTLTSEPDVVYVCGRLEEGDGGAGLFQYLPSSLDTDDDGITLNTYTGARVYQRVFDGVIDPRWYGVTYGSLSDQFTVFNSATEASVRYNSTLEIKGIVRLNQNTTIPAGASLSCQMDGWFVSTTNITMTFVEGSRFTGVDVCFAVGVQPVFQASVCDAVRLSWMGGSDDWARWTKFINATNEQYKAYVDVNVDLDDDVVVSSNYALDFTGGSRINITALADLDIGSLATTAPTWIISYEDKAYVGAVNIGSTVCYMEWFGGSHVNIGTENAIPFIACMKNERLDLLTGTLVYTVTNTTPFVFSNMNICQFNGNGSTININQDLNITVIETNNITMGGTGTFQVGAGVFKTSTIIMKLTGGAKSFRNSLVFDTNIIVQSNDSTVFGGLQEISGKLDNCTITLPSTVHINSSYVFTGCTFNKTGTPNIPAFSASGGTQTIKFNACTLSIDGLLIYSTNTSLGVHLESCIDSDNWSKPLSNGYAQIVMTGTGAINNPTAYSIDGYAQADYINIKPNLSPTVASASTTNWRGLGSLSSDGEYVILGAGVTLDANPYSANTIRYLGTDTTFAGGGSQVDEHMSTVFRYGGIVTTEVIYPSGQAPDPATKLVVWIGIPPIGSDPASPAAGYTYNNMPVTFGESMPTALPATNGAKLAVVSNAWGGQVDIRANNTTNLLYYVGDIYGDLTQSAQGYSPVYVKRMTRIVIYNAGTGTVPSGTKIKVVINPVLPTREQYQRFFPEKEYALYQTSTFYGDVGGAYNVNIDTSLRTSYLIGTWQLDTPYMFRDCDINGLQTAICRTPVATGLKAAMDLPVASWYNGNTLNGAYS